MARESTCDFAELERLFEAARSMEGAQRHQFLESECADRPELLKEVQGLLAADAPAAHYFDELRAAIAVGAEADLEQAVQPVLRVGPYETTRLLGRGGMGVVYQARRVDGAFEHDVALKLLHLDLDATEMRTRFAAERQLLARLDHPNIARLYDGGVTEEGRPYFVMELVRGVPIREYCRSRNLEPQAILQLFFQVIDAVSYLHRYLVVHRDLKPNNVLVTEEGSVKLLDFGIAKVLATDAAEELDTEGITRMQVSSHTRTGQQLLTPAYAAPEQMQNAPITTAADVFALGAILYELLTGQKIRRPEEGAIPAAPSQIVPSLSKDLDAICLKALRPEADLRYSSAEQLGNDLRRFRSGEPVLARDGSRLYFVTRFLRRNWRWAAAGFLVFLSVGIVALRERSLRNDAVAAEALATVEAAKATAVTDFLTELMASAKPEVRQGDDLTVVELVTIASERLRDAEATLAPDVEARVLHTLGDTMVSLGRGQEGIELLERALESSGGLEDSRPATLEIARSLAQSQRLYGSTEDSEALIRHVLREQSSALDPMDPSLLRTMNVLASLLWSGARYEEVLELDREILARRRQALGEQHADTLQSMNAVGSTLFSLGRYAEAIELYREALAVRERTDGPRHPATLLLYSNVAATEAELGDYAAAEKAARAAAEGRLAVMGPAHRDTGMALHNLGSVLAVRGDWEQAEQALQRAVEIREAIDPGGRASLASRSLLADVWRDRGEWTRAEIEYREVLDAQRSIQAQVQGYQDGDRTSLAWATLLLRRADPQQQDLQRARRILLDLLADPLAADPPDAALPGADLPARLAEWARCYLAMGDARRSLQVLDRLDPLFSDHGWGEHHPLVLKALETRWRALRASQTVPFDVPGEALAERLLRGRIALFGEGHPEVVRTRRLIDPAGGPGL